MVVFVVCHGCMLVLQHTWCHGQSPPPPPPLCVVAILCHHAMPPHPCHPHQTMSTGVQCVGVVPAVHTPHKPVCCMHCMVCVVVCSFTLVLMPHHQLCTPWAAMPWCVATSVFVLCVPCLPLCPPPPPPPCCTIGVCVVGQHQVSVVVGLFVD